MKYEDFKYVINDISHVYVGAKFTYEEVTEHEDVPQKLKEVVFRIFMQEVAEDTTFENHLFYLTPESKTYKALKKMKAKVKMSVWEPAKGFRKAGYVNSSYHIEDIVGNQELFAKKDTIIVEEVCISKIGLSMVLV